MNIKCKRKGSVYVTKAQGKDALFGMTSSDGYDDNSDSSDSEESVYSGLEEEPESEDESLQEEQLWLKSDSDEEIFTLKAQDKSEKKSSKKNKSSLKTQAKSPDAKHNQAVKLKADKSRVVKDGQSEQKHQDEYEVDSSDEEDIRNTVGNIPMEWYKEFEHIGYDLDGKKIGKPIGGDELDEFLDKMDNPNYWRTVHDKMTGQKVVLSDKDVDSISRLKQGKYMDAQYDPYQPWVDFFTNTVMQHPLTNRPETKESFLPSKYERQKVSKLVHAMKMGWIKPRIEKAEEYAHEKERKYYLIWGKDDQSHVTQRQRDNISAPKLALPGHEESYNPPPEYLFTEEEELAWKAKEPYERRVKVIPRKYSSLRTVPAYDNFVRERFERCLDLYLCPRKRIMRMNINPEDLIPKLPKPRDLMPFPTVQSLKFEGHESFVRCISVCPTGQWLASGADDGTVKLWEVYTTRCMTTLRIGGVIRSIAWNPNPSLSLIAVVKDSDVIVINTSLGDSHIVATTDEMLNSAEDQAEEPVGEKQLPITWTTYSGSDQAQGYRVAVSHPKTVSQVTWHGRGDYFAVTLKDGGTSSVFIHQLSKRRSQNPFRKPKGLVQCVLFHPVRPFFFVATQRYVRVYNLLKQELSKKLLTNVKWVSSMAVHPAGDHVIVGSYDCRLSWFDLDLSSKPFKTLRHHRKAIRHVAFHKRYPLFASASDDGTVIVCHGQVYNDLLKNPLIVPVKILRGHQITNDLGVLGCEFHPTQPWLFTSGADSTIRLFT